MTTEQTTTTQAPAATDPAIKRCCIVGTAGTWKQSPWNDLTVDILGLNDGFMLGYRLNGVAGLPRETIHFDLHPFAQMSFRPMDGRSMVHPDDVPLGAYLRPAGYIDWLRTRQFPVILNDAPKDWPHASTFPREAIVKKHGNYFASTPAWMLVWAVEQGYKEIFIMGIHLSTEWEYVVQRPNMEYWIRYALDQGVKIVLPSRCPLLKNGPRSTQIPYAYEVKPDLPLRGLEYDMQRIKARGASLHKQLAGLKWFDRSAKQELLARLSVLDLELADKRHEHEKANFAFQMT